jgi:hypothetical protein
MAIMLETAQKALKAAGWNHNLAEALAENGYVPETAALLSQKEVLNCYLEWNGIIGYTNSILDALHNAKDMGASTNG